MSHLTDLPKHKKPYTYVSFLENSPPFVVTLDFLFLPLHLDCPFLEGRGYVFHFWIPVSTNLANAHGM